jgi:hypothetical protein
LTSAVKYFNTKINVTNTEERILAYLISGMTIDSMNAAIRNGAIAGIHPDITITSLNRFVHSHGHSVDAFQLAVPNKEGNKKRYMSKPQELVQCGQLVEIDSIWTLISMKNQIQKYNQ